MRLEEAFSLVLDVEARAFVGHPTWRSIDVWPLMRQCLWFELTQVEEAGDRVTAVVASSLCRRLFQRLCAGLRAFRNRPASGGDEATAFVSRPVYLQKLPDGTLFDRIVDPLIFCMPDDARHAKYYVAPWPDRPMLHYPARLLRAARAPATAIPHDHRIALMRVAETAGISSDKLVARYAKSLQAFDHWYEAGRLFFDSRKCLKTVYLTSWYFPDMMGLIAAAREQGIETVDVQHGKQGKLQAMYSGWHIPPEGYQMMPDVFWCWGQPSADHILASSPDREKHRPVVGGYPWLDYYRRHVSRAAAPVREGAKKCVLVTTQPPQGDNTQPVPDFLLDFMRQRPEGVHFIFRCHPNDRNGPAYCRQRLSEFPDDLYDIDDGRSNLYDRMISATHHVTAYSSCCYEAGAFGVPTLLFGMDARTIYGDEIERGVFSWMQGSARDLALWLEMAEAESTDGGYIFSSLEHAASIVLRTEGCDGERHEMKERCNA